MLALKPVVNFAAPSGSLEPPWYDLHVHTAEGFSIRQIMEIV